MRPFSHLVGMIVGQPDAATALYEWLCTLHAAWDDDIRQMVAIKLLTDAETVYAAVVRHAAGLSNTSAHDVDLSARSDSELQRLDRALKGYVIRMCQNRQRDSHRENKRRPRSAPPERVLNLPDRREDVESALDAERFHHAWDALVADLSPGDRELVQDLVALARGEVTTHELVRIEVADDGLHAPDETMLRRVRERLFGRHRRVRTRLQNAIDRQRKQGIIDEELARMLLYFVFRLQRRRTSQPSDVSGPDRRST